MIRDRSGTRDGAAFYCVSSGLYFPGAVGLVNSLRLKGHDEPIYLLDLGLSAEQRELLSTEVTLVDAPAGLEPWLAKTVAPLRHPHETMVLIDVDMVVTRSLKELIERAGRGDVVGFENDVDRHCAEWGELLDLGEVRRQPYLCSGFVACGGDDGLELLELIDDRQRRVEFERTFFAANDKSYPLLFLDQDVLNAVLSSRVPAERVVPLPLELAPMPPFSGLQVLDEANLRCGYRDGSEPYVVHHFGNKPWAEPLHHGVYARLLRRALLDPAAPIKLPASALPPRFRRGPAAYFSRKLVNSRHRLRWHVTDPLRAGMRRGGEEPK